MSKKYEEPWYKLVGGLGVSVSVGAIFSFGALSPAFMKLTHSTTEDAASIGLGGNIGLWLYLIPGLSFDRFGTQFGFIVGFSLVLIGFIATCVALSLKAGFEIVAVTWAVAGHGCSWLFCTNLLSNVRSWKPEARGYAIGSLQAFFGMSAPLFISIWTNNIFNAEDYLVEFLAFMGIWNLCAVGIAVATGGGLDNFLDAGTFDKRAAQRFFRLQIYIAFLLLLIVCTGLAEQKEWASYVIIAAIIGGVPFVVFEDKFLFIWQDEKKNDMLENKLDEPLLIESTPTSTPRTSEVVAADAEPLPMPAVVVVATQPSQPQAPPPPPEPLAALHPQHWIEFWELFLVFGILTGGALSTSNSMVAIARSIGTCEYKRLAAFSLTLQTTCDALGRMLGGIAINTKLCDGAVVMAVGALCLAASHTAYSAAHGLMLHEGPYSTGNAFLFMAAGALGGLADGTAWTSCPWLTQARFGQKRYGDNFGIVTVAAVVGIIVFVKGVIPIGDTPEDDDYLAYNTTVLEYNYTSHTWYNETVFHPSSYNCMSIDDDDDTSCYGGKCFAVFHRSCQAAAVVGFICALDMERRRMMRVREQQQKAVEREESLQKAAEADEERKSEVTN